MVTDAPKPGNSSSDHGVVRYTVLSHRAIATWAVLIVLVGVGMAVWLLLAYTGGNADANRVQLDAIRTAGTIVVGTGGAAALLLAARRQRTAEITLKQKDRDQADVARGHALQEQVAEQTRQHQERIAAATEADAEARRITDLYTKAVDQLGSDKAPVRLGGLYALERLAQVHEDQRQTIVNVLCAYLRMPYAFAGDPPTDDASDQIHTSYRERVQEREVRLTAQRLLETHLRPQSERPGATFWTDIDLDLTGAYLIDFNLSSCTVRSANFFRATFIDDASFDWTNFTSGAIFSWATFTGDASFTAAKIAVAAMFARTTFTSDASFISATFTNFTSFDEATFTNGASFARAIFTWGVPREVKQFWSPPEESDGGNIDTNNDHAAGSEGQPD